MTFYEAAVEILRRSGRPLHFKKITEVALRQEMLSHVGKTPETTMESRLDQEVKKADGSWIVMTRPGVYMLREDILARLNEEAAERDAEVKAREAEAESRREDEQRRKKEADEARRARRAERDDDDDDDDEEDTQEVDADSDADEPRPSRRRRRRRRGRSNGAVEQPAEEEESRRTRRREKNDKKDEGRSDNGRGEEKERGRKRGRSDRGDRGAKKSLDELDGARCDSIAEAAYAVLAANGRDTMTAEQIAEIVFDKKLIRFHTHDPAATIQSAIVTDNQVRSRKGRRPLFAQYRNERWGLTEWGVSKAGIEKERKVLEICDELRDEAVKQLGDAIAEIKAEAFEMVVMTLLERLDYRNLKVAKRTSDGDTFFTADWRRGFSDLRVCVQVIADSRSRLEGAAVKELRETLEHYAAAEGIVILLGEVTKDAVKESRDTDSAKVTIIDRDAFMRLLVEEGIGVKTYSTPIVMVDHAFVDALQ